MSLLIGIPILLAGWFAAAVIVGIPLGKLLRRNRRAHYPPASE